MCGSRNGECVACAGAHSVDLPFAFQDDEDGEAACGLGSFVRPEESARFFRQPSCRDMGREVECLDRKGPTEPEMRIPAPMACGRPAGTYTMSFALTVRRFNEERSESVSCRSIQPR